MRLVFMGTPDFSVPCLSELINAGHEIAAVYTQPPRKAGRGMKEQMSPVQAFAESAGLPVRHPLSLKDTEEQQKFALLEADAAVVVAYGLILPQPILDAPAMGCFNVHASLLPRWRGAAPVQRAIMACDTETGVTIMQMEAGLDTGPMLLVERTKIGADDTYGDLHDRLSQIGASAMVRALAALERGGLTATVQPEDGVTYARKIEKAECRIDWAKPACEVLCQIRGLAPRPGAFFEFEAKKGPKRLIVLKADSVEGEGAPGEVLNADNRLVVACSEKSLDIREMRVAGKGTMSAAEFLRGFAVDPGVRVQ